MGIDTRTVKWLTSLRDINWDKTLMLGRQSMRLPFTGYAEPLFYSFGASVVASLDNSNYENATHIHDLNEPVPQHLVNSFTVVFDGGTLEHVWDIPQALRRACEMVQVGGTFLSLSPANNYIGHGFYQTSPEFFYRGLRHYGFDNIRVLLCVSGVLGDRWYYAKPPEQCSSWPTFTTSQQVTLYVNARKNSQPGEMPQQSHMTQMPATKVRWKNVGRLLYSKAPLLARTAERLLWSRNNIDKNTGYVRLDKP